MMQKFHQDDAHNNEEISDEMLMRAIGNGATWAMEPLYQRYGRFLYALVYHMVSDHQVAEELLQDIFLLVWKHATLYSPQAGTVRNWLISIARNRTIDYSRMTRRRSIFKQASWEEVESDERTAQPDAMEGALRSIQADQVRRALMALSTEQRMVIELAFFQGWTHVEIAEGCGLPLGTVKSRINLGLKHLKDMLARIDFTEP